jgi:hypothetical protein
MKCIKNEKTGEIRRVADLVAWELETKGWGYIPKSEWKSATRVEKPKTEKVVSEDGKPRRSREKKNKR